MVYRDSQMVASLIVNRMRCGGHYLCGVRQRLVDQRSDWEKRNLCFDNETCFATSIINFDNMSRSERRDM